MIHLTKYGSRLKKYHVDAEQIIKVVRFGDCSRVTLKNGSSLDVRERDSKIIQMVENDKFAKNVRIEIYEGRLPRTTCGQEM